MILEQRLSGIGRKGKRMVGDDTRGSLMVGCERRQADDGDKWMEDGVLG